ncbi:hypothetical protein C8R46DRAFT_490839 [Mycena filopes]|nr:hypothetical protein C8R46DRAFT_490839 [Mycena filopes]
MGKERPVWPLGSYGPAKYEPTLLTGLDESPEELRLKAATAMKAGTMNEYLAYESSKMAAAEQVYTNAFSNAFQAFEQASQNSRGVRLHPPLLLPPLVVPLPPLQLLVNRRSGNRRSASQPFRLQPQPRHSVLRPQSNPPPALPRLRVVARLSGLALPRATLQLRPLAPVDSPLFRASHLYSGQVLLRAAVPSLASRHLERPILPLNPHLVPLRQPPSSEHLLALVHLLSRQLKHRPLAMEGQRSRTTTQAGAYSGTMRPLQPHRHSRPPLRSLHSEALPRRPPSLDSRLSVLLQPLHRPSVLHQQLSPRLVLLRHRLLNPRSAPPHQRPSPRSALLLRRPNPPSVLLPRPPLSVHLLHLGHSQPLIRPLLSAMAGQSSQTIPAEARLVRLLRPSLHLDSRPTRQRLLSPPLVVTNPPHSAHNRHPSLASPPTETQAPQQPTSAFGNPAQQPTSAFGNSAQQPTSAFGNAGAADVRFWESCVRLRKRRPATNFRVRPAAATRLDLRLWESPAPEF